jgi:2-oxo-4-hydroxy-4-carboxy-5-ureidoimidazoline decarboxylase
MPAQVTLQQLNVLDQESFTQALRSLFEGPPWMVAQAWFARPFADRMALQQALVNVIHQAPVERQIALIQAHPDLVGRAALSGMLTAESTSEQASAGLDRLSAQEIATFTSLNQQYHERFGFPFVICVRENKKESILSGFATRLQHSKSREIETALDEIAKIGCLRLLDLVQQDAVE